MHAMSSRRWFAPAAALALAGIAALAAQAADTTDFQAGATFQIDSGASHGNQIFFTASGQATQGGSFYSTGQVHDNWGNYHETGVQTLDFGNGNTLTIYFEDDWIPDISQRVGPYVITDGTGTFAGASGGGMLMGIPNFDGTGTVYLDGTLSW